MLTKEETKTFLDLHHKAKKRILDIVDLYDTIDGRCYTVTGIETTEDCISVNVEYSYCSCCGTEFSTLNIDPELLYDEEEYSKLRAKVDQIIREKFEAKQAEKLKENELKEKSEQELLKSLLEKYKDTV